MKKLIKLFIIGLVTQFVSAQENLIPNPSFEEYYGCDYRLVTADIKDVLTHWTSRKSSPRYYNTTCFNDPKSDYYKAKGFAAPIHGNGFVSTVLDPSDDSWTNIRQYLQVDLLRPIVQGRIYFISYYITLTLEDQDPLSHYGVNFTDSLIIDSITNIGTFEPILLNPTLEVDTLMDLKFGKWQKVWHCFRVEEDYSVMTVGIFANVDDIIGAFDIKHGFTYIAYDNFELYEIDSLIDLEITKNDTICVGDCVTLSTNHSLIEGEFVWDLPGSDIGASRDSVVTVCYGTAGTYDVGISVDHCIGTYDNYFTKAITVIAAIDHIPPWEEMTVCAGEEVEIDLSFVTYNFLWEDGTIEKKRKFTKDGIYKYTLSNGYCEAEYIIQVIYDIKPTTQLIEVQSCKGENIEYNNKTYDLPGIYLDTLSSTEGCDSVFYEIKYSYFEVIPMVLDGQYGFCPGEVTKLSILSLHSDILWSDGSQSITISIDRVGDYWVQGVDEHLCTTELIFTIEEYLSPEVETEDLLDIWYEEGIELPVTYFGAISEYAWSMSEALNCSYCAFPKLIHPVEGKYEIVIKNDKGCEARSVLEIRFRKVKLYLPNTIAKNPIIQSNGVFYAQSDVYIKYDLSIYDRWGDVLYNGVQLSSNNQQEGWNPRGSVNPGVFVYRLSYIENGKQILLIGDVTVL